MSGESDPTVVRPLRRPVYKARRTWLTALASAVAVILAVGVARELHQAPPANPPPYRQSGTAEPVIESRLESGQVLPASAVRLEWTPLAGGRYDVAVTTEDLDAVASARGLEEAAWTVPESRLEGLPPGAVLLWQVEAVLPDGRRVASPTFKISLRRAGDG